MKTAATVKKKRSRRSLSNTDRFTLTAFVGIPTLLQIILLWIPAVVTIILSFTYWNGVRLKDIQWAGIQNYKNIFVNNPLFYQALKNNGIWLAF
ncbi:MAG: sugar ABC transporter permease, partial [Actinobacteria bacterium]|nr:sugar ABC transporter permease [Actinomycetota bacterium]